MLPYRFGAIVIILLALAIRASGASRLGTQSDEGVHVAVAEWLADGDMVYRDLFENRTPAVEVILAAAFRLAGPSVLLGRAMTLAVVTLTVAALITIGRLAQRLARPGRGRRPWQQVMAGWASGLLFGLAPLAVFWSRYTMLENWQTAAAALAIATGLLAVVRGRIRWWLASGLLAGAAVLSKQSGLVVAGVLVLYLLIIWLGGRQLEPKRALFLWLAGFVSLLAAFVIWLAWRGALSDFFHFLSAADRMAPLTGLAAKMREAGSWIIRRPAIVLALTGSVAVLRSGRRAAWLPLIWAAAETVALFGPEALDLGWGGFSHYALPALAAISVVAGLGLAQLARWLAAGADRQKMAAAGLLALALATAGGWFADLKFAATQQEYPGPNFDDEKRIGQVAAELTGETEPILVLGNSIIYHWAERNAPNRFFQLPAYLPESRHWPEVEAGLLNALGEGGVRTALISRRHLEGRLSGAMLDALQTRWAPAALFSYPYQGDMFLYLPRGDQPDLSGEPLARFDAGIDLREIAVRVVGEQDIQVRLWWSAVERPGKDWTVFVHLFDSEGRFLAQHDGVPGVGFRPASSWNPGDVVEDGHWLFLPGAASIEGLQLAIGLYDPATGQRSRLLAAPGEQDAYVVEIEQLR